MTVSLSNSTAFEGTDRKGNKEFIGSKTETALLGLARDYLGMDDVATDRHNAQVIQPIPFNSERKCMGCVVKKEQNGKTFYRLFVKGASEILLKYSNQVIDTSGGNLSQHLLSEPDRRVVENTIMGYASKSLRTIALVYRDFPQWPPRGARQSTDDKSQAEFEDVFNDMVFIGVVGIMDPLRPGVTKAVEDCRKAGVLVPHGYWRQYSHCQSHCNRMWDFHSWWDSDGRTAIQNSLAISDGSDHSSFASSFSFKSRR